MSVRQHKCGTCRFYQEARLASSGWCHHPQRKTTNDLMIMVRKNELACRDEWSHDLWEARANPSVTDAASPELFPDRKMPPATESEIAALLQSERSPNGASGVSGQQEPDDVVLSELGVPSERPTRRERPDVVPEWAAPTPRPLESPAPPPRISELGTRNAIIRARETYRERSRLEAARANEISRLTAKAEPEPSSSHGVDVKPPLTDLSQDVDVARDSGTMQELAAQPPAAPTDKVSIPLVDNESVAQPTSSSLECDWDHQGSQPAVRFARVSVDEPVPPMVGSEEPELTWRGDRPDLDMASVQADLQTWPADGDDEISQNDGGLSASHDIVPAYQIDRASGERIWPELLSDVVYDAQEVHTEHDNDDVVAGNDFDDDVISPSGLDLAAHLPRICRSCRDFRPAENGERGWCANQWAFSHRRMVDAGERTPCESVLGNWWLPVDEVWSEAADVSSHGQPTPLLDAWLPQPQQLEPTRRRS